GIDEQRNHHDIVLGARAMHQGQVPGVKRAHRWHEADSLPALTHAGERSADLVAGADNFHASRSAASWRVARTSASHIGNNRFARSATAVRWRATVDSSPRAIGPVSAEPPSSAQPLNA